MKKFIVVALSVGAMSNKIFKSGDVVSADAFPEGAADKLVEQGFLKPYDGKEIEHTVTDDDLNNNPDLVDEGVKSGDVVSVPVQDEKSTSKKNNSKK